MKTIMFKNVFKRIFDTDILKIFKNNQPKPKN